MISPDTYKVIVEGLQLPIRLGCSSAEREAYQNAELDIMFDIAATSSVASLGQTVCYLTAVQTARKFAANQEWDLIENFLPALAERLFEEFPVARGIEATLRKFVVAGAKASGVKMTFKRKA